MSDMIFASLRVGALSGVFLYLWKVGRTRHSLSRTVWILLLAGVGLLAVEGLLDISDNFPSLKGVLMKQTGMDEEGAFRCLQKLASQNNQKLIEVARSILTAGAAH